MPHQPLTETQRSFSKRLRKTMTEAERRLWTQLRAHRLMGLGFKRQMPIGNYVADFACAEFRLIVEVDGAHHALPDKAVRDRLRTEKLGETGWIVVRFWNDEVMREMDAVCDHIVAVIKAEWQRLPPPSVRSADISPARGENGVLRLATGSRDDR